MTPPTVHPFLMELMRGSDEVCTASASIDQRAWEQIATDADRQGLTPLLCTRLKERGPDCFPPPPLWDRIKAGAARVAARNLMLAQELAALLRAFASKHIVCAPIRGLALAELLYGETTARPMGDVDLLVRKADLQTVGNLLLRLGFREMDRRPGFARTYSNTLEFVKEGHGWIIVEPHWTIAYPPFADRIDMDAVWKRCVKGRVLGMETWLLGREDLLLHLCFHLIHRRDDAPMLWFYELDRLIRQDDTSLDWAEVARVASEAGQDMLLLEALRQVKGIFQTPIPEHVVTGPVVENRVLDLLAGNSNADGRESLALFFTLQGWRSKLRYTLALLFPSPEFMALHYGYTSQGQIWLGYSARIGFLCKEAAKGLLGLLHLRASAPRSPIRD